MSVITFWNNENTETGKTMSLAAIATHMAIEHNNRILVISTTDKKDRLEACFWEEDKKAKLNLGIFGPNTRALETENGIKGLGKMFRSNKITPEIITNYTKVVFKDRLEILLGNQDARYDTEAMKLENMRLFSLYPSIVEAASHYYDRVFVDLDYNVPEDIREQIIKQSDIIVLNLNQRLSTIKKFQETKETNPLLKSPKTLLLIGRYDKYSKFNSKNISRFLKEKNQILTIPYNTLFFEAAEEAEVPNLFLRFKKFYDQDDRNAFFIEEVKRATENIIYRLQEIQANIL